MHLTRYDYDIWVISLPSSRNVENKKIITQKNATSAYKGRALRLRLYIYTSLAALSRCLVWIILSIVVPVVLPHYGISSSMLYVITANIFSEIFTYVAMVSATFLWYSDAVFMIFRQFFLFAGMKKCFYKNKYLELQLIFIAEKKKKWQKNMATLWKILENSAQTVTDSVRMIKIILSIVVLVAT